jgi:hypothetical protein
VPKTDNEPIFNVIPGRTQSSKLSFDQASAEANKLQIQGNEGKNLIRSGIQAAIGSMRTPSPVSPPSRPGIKTAKYRKNVT